MAEKRIISTEIHRREHRRLIDRYELEQIVGDAVLAMLGLHREQVGLKVSVRFEDATEGSPAYKVGSKATVDIVEDLTIAARELPAVRESGRDRPC